MFLVVLLLAGPVLDGSVLTRDLDWSFTEDVRNEGSTTVHSFESEKPISEGSDGKTFLRFHVTVSQYENESAALGGYHALRKKADPNTGLSYAWDYVVQTGDAVVHLSAPCLWSRANFGKLVDNVDASLGKGRVPGRTLRCSCGSGCTPAGGPKFRVEVRANRGLDEAAVSEAISKTLVRGGWTPVSGDAEYTIEARHRPVGLKSVLELTLKDAKGEVVKKVTAGASPHVMPEVAPELAAQLSNAVDS